MIYAILISILALFFAIKFYIKSTTGKCTSKASMKGKTVIVTGSNTGIGKETAKDLASRGAKVILACRNLTKANEAAQEIKQLSNNSAVYALKCDLNSFKSIKDFVSKFNEKETRLDVLINNAGVYETNVNQLTEDDINTCFQSNHFGHFLLTMLLLNKLKENPSSSRIVNVSSLAHLNAKKLDFEEFTSDQIKDGSWSIYEKTKLCNVLFTKSLSRRLKNSSVTVNSLHPGVILTDFFRNLTGILGILFAILKPLVLIFVKTIEEGAQTTIYLAVEPSLDKVSGEYFADCKIATTSELAKDEELAEKLWNESIKLAGLYA